MADSGDLDTGRLQAIIDEHAAAPWGIEHRAQLIRLPRLTDVGLSADATRFSHGRSLPPVPPARPRS